MAIKVIRGKTMPIGVDLGTSSVKLAQLRVTGDEIELLAAGAMDIPQSCRKDFGKCLGFLGSNLHSILKSNAFKGRQCILSLPAETTFVQHVKLPKLSPDQTAKALRLELQNKLPYPVGDAIIRHVVAGESHQDGEAKQEVIVVATRRATLEAYLATIRRARLDVVGVNIESCAIVECFAHLFRRNSDLARTIMFVDIGLASTQVVLSHGKKIVFARNLAIGGQMLDEAVADGMHMPLEQAHSLRWDLLKGASSQAAEDELYQFLDRPVDQIAHELTQCLRYYESVFRNQAVERAILIGGQAYDKRLCQMLAKRLNLPAQIGDPLVRVKRVDGAGLSTGLDRREPQPNWAVAVGLSLGASTAA